MNQINHHRQRRGFSLVITLAILSLLTFSAIAFLSLALSERKSSAAYAAGIEAQRYAEASVALVTSQIQQAVQDAEAGAAGTPYAWISQPGLLRTFRPGISGTPEQVRAYKLYSANEPISDDYDPAADVAQEVPADWETAFGGHRYTDINEPVFSASGQAMYPILPARATFASVQGASATLGTAYANNGGAGIAMPVQWIYLLEDGTMTAMDQTGNLPGASSANRPVSRVAYWTDDESCKLNVNTAAHGTYWDIARCRAPSETAMSRYQPAQGEFQRYPGHPSTISLLPVLNPFGVTDPNSLYDMAPRVIHTDTDSNRGLRRPSGISVPDGDRLYATIDDYLFRPNRTSNSPMLSDSEISALRFFLTAHSRSPDLNLFGRPRVSIWPHYAGTANPVNKLLAFCATVGDPAAPAKRRAYYFRRTLHTNNNQSFFEARHPQTTYTSHLRNQEIYQYLQSLTTANAPGYGNSFAAKYTPAERDQILTEIFDYIRSGVQLNEYRYREHFTKTADGNTAGAGQVTPIVISTADAPASNPTRGLGRFPTITEAALCFTTDTATGPNNYEMTLLFEPFCVAEGYSPLVNNYQIRIRGLRNLLVNGSPVYPNDTADGRVQGKQDEGNDGNIPGGLLGIIGFRWCYRNMSPYNSTLNTNLNSNRFMLAPSNRLVFRQTQDLVIELRSNIKPPGPDNNFDPSVVVQTLRIRFPDSDSTSGWPLPSGRLSDSSGGFFSQRVRIGTGGSAAIAPNTFVRPGDVVRSVQIKPDSPFADYRLLTICGDVPSSAFAPTDATAYGSSTTTHVHNLRGASIVGLWNGQVGNALANITGASLGGSLVPGTTHHSKGWPAVPYGLNGAVMTGGVPGDWDNGMGWSPDGPFINKPDEGNNDVTDMARDPYFSTQYVKDEDGVTFSPNRHLPSAVMFGSLPTGARRGNPWQTLLFCPNSPAAVAGASHPGEANPPDHLLLDLFTMPIAEPYAISEPFSTAGKVNLNSQIAPFSYIQRHTALASALESVQIFAVKDSDSQIYKSPKSVSDANVKCRWDVDSAQTLNQFTDRFTQNKPFITESEICTIWLHPKGHAGAPRSFWNDKRLTGDNGRERPYADLYPKLTVRSNVYTVHVRAQMIQPTLGPFDPQNIQVKGEYRGSYTIERYLDPEDSRLGDSIDPDRKSIYDAYRFRTILARRFNP
jgi:uncharacterized protein (TIGR02600 family)